MWGLCHTGGGVGHPVNLYKDFTEGVQWAPRSHPQRNLGETPEGMKRLRVLKIPEHECLPREASVTSKAVLRDRLGVLQTTAGRTEAHTLAQNY